jgi:hypothetical protein
MPVDLNDCRVNHGVFHVGIVRNGIEYPFKNIGLDPMPEALEHRVPMAKACHRAWRLRGLMTPGAFSSLGGPQGNDTYRG